MGLSVGNSGGASTEVGAGSHAYMSRVSMFSVSNGLMETIPNDQTLVLKMEYLICVRQNRWLILNIINLFLSDCPFVKV